MSLVRPWRRHGIHLAGLGLSLLLATGCGGAGAPAETVPELDSILGRVDRALAAKQFDQARTELDRLVQVTIAAHEAGDLDSAQTEPILAAVTSLTARFPRLQPTDDKAREALKKERDELTRKLAEEKKRLAEQTLEQRRLEQQRQEQQTYDQQEQQQAREQAQQTQPGQATGKNTTGGNDRRNSNASKNGKKKGKKSGAGKGNDRGSATRN